MHKQLLCDHCKEKIATVHYTEIIDNKLKKMDLCEECAKKKNIGINVQFSVADILKGLTESSSQNAEDEDKTAKACPVCGLTFKRFRKTGKLGCGECYGTFSDELVPIIADIHRSTEHVGYKPQTGKPASQGSSRARVQLDKLNTQLEEAVKNEAYEEAAILRDKIKSLKQKNDRKGKKK